MVFGVLGDIHGEFSALDAIMRRHVDVAFWLSVGDVGSDDLRYPEPFGPLYWIQGNNEDFNAIARGSGPRNLHFLPNGTRLLIHLPAESEKSSNSRPDRAIAVGALGGTFAPTWYETAAADLPYPGRNPNVLPGRGESARQHSSPAIVNVRDDKRRHFVREQVEALEACGHVDVLLTHEAPRPFFVQAGPRRLDAGKTVINELLAKLKPELHFFGHHHRYSDDMRTGVRSIGLDLVTRSYVLVDRQTYDVTKIDYH